MNVLHNVCWYLDGHHATMGARGAIPPIFKHFEGFNRPEQSKHKRKTEESMKSEELEEFKNSLILMPQE